MQIQLTRSGRCHRLIVFEPLELGDELADLAREQPRAKVPAQVEYAGLG